MILTANSEVVRQTRRKTGNGWHHHLHRREPQHAEARPDAARGGLAVSDGLPGREGTACGDEAALPRGRSVSGDRAGRRPARHARRGHRGGALHRRMVRLRTDRRSRRGDFLVHLAQHLGFRRALHAGRTRAAARGTDPELPAPRSDRRADAGGLGRGTGAHRAAVLRHGDRADAGRHGDMALSPAAGRQRQRARSARTAADSSGSCCPAPLQRARRRCCRRIPVSLSRREMGR